MRFKRLDALGFNWDRHWERWNEMVEHLRIYEERHGDCKVPDAYQTENGKNLGSWVITVRGLRRGTTDAEISPHRIAELDAIGFVWENVLHLHWDQMYEELRRYRETHGHCRVPPSYQGDGQNQPRHLGQWVAFQRQCLEQKLEKTGDQMYVDRRERLNAIGFEWSFALEENWNNMFQALQQYKEKHGDFRVPYTYEGPQNLPRKLGPWVYDQTKKIPVKAKEGTQLFAERKRCMEKIGFCWERDVAQESWMSMFERLKKCNGCLLYTSDAADE